MYRNLFLVFFLFIFSACSSKVVDFSEFRDYKKDNVNNEILIAFMYKYNNQNEKAKDAFLSLFKKYKNEIFLENALSIALISNLANQEELINLSKPYLNNNNIKRLVAYYYFKENDINTAYELTNELINKEKDIKNYELYADILTKKAEFKKANYYYSLVYSELKSENILLKIIQNYALLNDVKSMKAVLEKSKEELGNSYQIWNLLAKIYLDEKNYTNLKNVFLNLYDITKNEKYLYAILDILNLEKDYKQALEFALKYKLKGDILLFLYQANNEFEPAYKYSLELFKQTKDKKYLLNSAVFEFENALSKKQVNKEVIDSVVFKFENSIDDNSDALYLNYYGYLLIDNDLDIKKGIELVNKALQKDKNNLFYLDSLAWGYYKLKDCKKAWDIFKETLKDKEFSNSKESKEHRKAILKCLKEKK